MTDRETAAHGDRRRDSVFRWIGRWMGSDAGLAGPTGPATASARPPGSTAGRTAEHTPRDAARVFPDIPGFDILDEAGRGGMGEVYVARDLGLDKVVALKLIDARGLNGPAVRARFEREVRAMSRIDHPNIVPVYHAAYCHGRAYFTMKYIPGGNLAKHMARVRADLRRAVRVVAVIARAVQHAHEAGILHRDLKPHNILLGDGDEPLVADFGLAKFAGDGADDLTRTGAVLGTRQYMSPEQTRGKAGAFTPACDIWALGVILYEVLSGRRPFADDDEVELYRQIREQEPDSCSSTNPDAPPELEAVVRTCLAKDPLARYETAGQVADALERWLADGSVPPKPARSRRWPRRAAVAAVAVGLLAGAGAVWVGTGQPPAGDGPTEEKPTVAGPAPPAGPIDPRPIADRLRAGETVVLIPRLGGPGSSSSLAGGAISTVRPSGQYVLGSFSFGLAELSTDDLPLPVKLVAEVAWSDGTPGASFGGVYVGRRDSREPFAHSSAVQYVFTKSSGKAAQEYLAEWRTESSWWRPVAAGITTSRHTFQRRAVPPRPNRHGDAHWHNIDVVVTADSIRGTVDGQPFPPISVADASDQAARATRAAAAEVGGPTVGQAVGPGVGLCAYDGEFLFRNVTLVPVAP